MLIAVTPALVAAQVPLRIAYEFRADSPATHLGDVTVRISGDLRDSTLIQLPAWYPGRYAIFNFAANVQEAQATCNGTAVAAPKADKQTWVVRCPGRGRNATIAFGYRVWWDDLSGSFSQIDSTHVNLNPGNVFPYVVGHKPDPVTVTYHGPAGAGWRVMNGAMLAPAVDSIRQAFPNYDVFIDHPTEISGDFTVDTFTVGTARIAVLIHAAGGPADERSRALLVDGARRIVAADTALWHVLPTDRYTFLLHFTPGNPQGGDGMEHLTSTQIISPRALDTVSARRYGGMSHEFFHTWNMKRLRAAELGPWDYTRENPTATLWVGEGFTNYYGNRQLFRAGLIDQAQYLFDVGNAAWGLQVTPGRLLMSAEESSRSAWFFDGARLRQQTNLRATTISYYNKGEVLGWLLDLEVRARTNGAKSLDDVMRLLWQRCWNGATTSYYLQGHGYRETDVRQALEDVAGGDFGAFFTRYVAGVDELPYDSILARAGLAARRDSLAWTITPLPGASETARRIAQAWLEGR